MADAPQTFKTHRQLVTGYHVVLTVIQLVLLIGAIVNLVRTSGSGDALSAWLILLMVIALGLLSWYARAFPLRAQDRVIRLEENFRNYVRLGAVLDGRLTIQQVIALRFADDAEFDELARRAADEGLTPNEIKSAIKTWKSDHYRV